MILVQSWVCSPKSVARPISTSPARAASLFSALTASSRFPSSTSTEPTSCGTFAAILGLLGSTKWIIRLGRAGTSRTGAGAPTARGVKKSFALRMREPLVGMVGAERSAGDASSAGRARRMSHVTV